MNRKPKLLINPPARDRRWECCGKRVSKLKPFGKADAPLLGDFNGAVLVKTFREDSGCIGPSWECRDCIILSDEEYWKRRLKTKS
jgi:hypothetical protein